MTATDAPALGNWNDRYEAMGRQLARALDTYLKDLAPGFRVTYSPTNWDSNEGLLVIAACRLLCRRGVLRMEMREAAETIKVPEAVTQVVGRYFDAMTIDEKATIKGLHFDLDESKWRVNVTLVKEPESATADPADAAGADDRPGDLPHGENPEPGPAGLRVPGAEPATDSDRGPGEAAAPSVLPPAREG